MKARPHRHYCTGCGTPTLCRGEVVQSFGGAPEWLCLAYQAVEHGDVIVLSFLCEACEEESPRQADVPLGRQELG